MDFYLTFWCCSFLYDIKLAILEENLKNKDGPLACAIAQTMHQITLYVEIFYYMQNWKIYWEEENIKNFYLNLNLLPPMAIQIQE